MTCLRSLTSVIISSTRYYIPSDAELNKKHNEVSKAFSLGGKNNMLLQEFQEKPHFYSDDNIFSPHKKLFKKCRRFILQH